VASLVGDINAYVAYPALALSPEPVSLREILQTIKAEHEAILMERRIEWLVPENVPSIRANREEIVRVIRNYVDNALKHGGDSLSKIEIDYTESEDFHVIAVNNNGAEINSGNHQKIFAPFIRRNKSEQIKGSGLGLAIVSEIAEKHRGKAWSEHYYPQGMSFKISIHKNLK
jgi:light-regulated signal transduction histidine kinase (bacteriophytochrome)